MKTEIERMFHELTDRIKNVKGVKRNRGNLVATAKGGGVGTLMDLSPGQIIMMKFGVRVAGSGWRGR